MCSLRAWAELVSTGSRYVSHNRGGGGMITLGAAWKSKGGGGGGEEQRWRRAMLAVWAGQISTGGVLCY